MLLFIIPNMITSCAVGSEDELVSMSDLVFDPVFNLLIEFKIGNRWQFAANFFTMLSHNLADSHYLPSNFRSEQVGNGIFTRR